MLREKIGFTSAAVLVIANMIGTGIFTTSGFIIKELGNPQAMLLCWFVGGIFALSGALCYGELGAMFPRTGGEYAYLRESFGKRMAFLSGWISLIVGFSAPIAASSIAFATYVAQVLPGSGPKAMATPLINSSFIVIAPITLLALAVIVVFSLVHAHSLVAGSRVQNVLTSFKVILILVFIAAGLAVDAGSVENFLGRPVPTVVFSDTFAVSLIFISFAYSGWNAAAYLGAEINNPRKNIPAALITGTFVVMCLYMLLNVVYIYALSVDEMSGVVEVGAKAALNLFGPRISPYIAGAIAIGLLSVISAMIMAGPRVYYAMAEDGVFFWSLAQLKGRHETPVYAIFFQAGIAMVMVITASFDKLLFYIGFTLSLFAVFTVAGLIVLRLRRPSLPRAYRTWGYPFTPLLFIVGNLWIIYFSITNKWIVSLFGLGTIATGSLAYRFFNNRSSPYNIRDRRQK